MLAHQLYLGMIHPLVVSLMLLGQPSEPQAPSAAHEAVKDESGCTPILEKFKGMQLAEAKIDIATGLLRMVYWRKVSKHQVILFLVVREECAGSYRIVSAHPFDPEPAACPKDSVCI